MRPASNDDDNDFVDWKVTTIKRFVFDRCLMPARDTSSRAVDVGGRDGHYVDRTVPVRGAGSSQRAPVPSTARPRRRDKIPRWAVNQSPGRSDACLLPVVDRRPAPRADYILADSTQNSPCPTINAYHPPLARFGRTATRSRLLRQSIAPPSPTLAGFSKSRSPVIAKLRGVSI